MPSIRSADYKMPSIRGAENYKFNNNNGWHIKTTKPYYYKSIEKLPS